MNDLTSILLICAAGLSLAWPVAAQRRLVADAARRFVALPRLRQVALVLAVGVMTVCAQKQGTSNREQGTSAVAEASGSDFNAENGDLRTETRSSSQISATSDTSKLRAKTALTSTSANPCESVKSVAITTNDLARGYAMVGVRTNETVSYAMPTNGIEVGTWCRTGAYRDVVRVALPTEFSAENGDMRTETRSSSQVSETSNDSVLRAKKTGPAFAFPLGGICVTSLWVYTWGKVRPRLRDRAHEIVAVGTPMSCVRARDGSGRRRR